MSTNETYTHLDEVLRAAMQMVYVRLGTEDPDNLKLSKEPHSKNISIDDWNTLVDQVEISSKDVERLYSLLTNLVNGLNNSDLQIRVPAEPANDTDAASKKYTDDLIKDITGFTSTDTEGFGILGNIAGLLNHVLHDTAHDVKLSVSKTEDDYKLTAELFEEKPEKGDAKAISTSTVSLSGFVDPIISRIIERINSKEAYVLSYELLEDESGYLCTGKGKAILKNIEIASEVDGKPVVAIASEAFKDWGTLESVTIPSSVNTIGKGVFKGCSSLKSLTVPFVGLSIDSENEDTLFGNLFHETDPKDDSLYYHANQSYTWRDDEGNGSKNFWIPKSLKSITVTGGALSWGMFQNLSHVQHIDVSNIATDTLGKFIFHQCSALTGLRLPNSIKTIDQGALSTCTALKSIGISDILETVGDAAFADCTSLEELDFTSSKLTTLAPNSFKGCTKLSKVLIPNTLKTVGSAAFASCGKLTSIVIPSSVTAVGKDSFKGCSNLVIYCAASAKPKDWDDGWASTDPLAIYWNGTRLDTIVKSVHAAGDIDLVKFTDTVKNVFHNVTIDLDDPESKDYGVITFEQLGGGTKKIDLPLELIVSTAPDDSYYDSDREILVIGLANGKSIEIPLEDILNAVEAAVEAANAAKSEAITAKNEAVLAKQGADKALAQAEQAVTDANTAKGEAITAKNEAIAAKNTAKDLAEDFSDAISTVEALDDKVATLENVVGTGTGTGTETLADKVNYLIPLKQNVILGSSARDKVRFSSTNPSETVTADATVYPRLSTIAFESSSNGDNTTGVRAEFSTISGKSLRSVYAKYSYVCGNTLGPTSGVLSIPNGIYDSSIFGDCSVIACRETTVAKARYSVVAGLTLNVDNLEGCIVSGVSHMVRTLPSDNPDTDPENNANRLSGLNLSGNGHKVYNANFSTITGSNNTLGDSEMPETNGRRTGTFISGANNTANANYSFVSGQYNHIGSSGNVKSFCLVAGRGHYATAYDQTLVGKYSDAKSNTLFAVGDGESVDDRHNAFEIRRESDGSAAMYLSGKKYGIDSVAEAVNAQTATEAKQFTGTAYVTSGGTSTNTLNTVIADLDKRLKSVGFKQGALEFVSSNSQDGNVAIDLKGCTVRYGFGIGLLYIPKKAFNLDNEGDNIVLRLKEVSCKDEYVTVLGLENSDGGYHAQAGLRISGDSIHLWISHETNIFAYNYTNYEDICIWFNTN